MSRTQSSECHDGHYHTERADHFLRRTRRRLSLESTQARVRNLGVGDGIRE